MRPSKNEAPIRVQGRINIHRTHQGGIAVVGQVQKPAVDDIEAAGSSDRVTEEWLVGMWDSVTEVVREVEAMRLAGRLEPFHEGQKVGVLPRRVARSRRLTDAQVRAAHNARMEDRRTEMLALRKKNDEDLARLAAREVLYGW